jgi:hypothetical protein
MRTTIDLPDELYRTLKAQAALRGTTLRDLLRDLIERGLHQPEHPASGSGPWGAPPVIVGGTGRSIGPVTAARLREFEEAEDVERVGASR